jgi:hypothetical protein
MKKKLLALLAIIAFVAAPTFANTAPDKFSDLKTDASHKVSNNTTHPTWAAGLVLGTNIGVQLNYQATPNLTIEGAAGFGFIDQNLMIEIYGMYKVYSFEINDTTLDFKAGLGYNIGFSFDVPMTFISFSSTDSIPSSFVGAGEIVYSFDDNLPLDLSLRVAMGVKLDVFAHNVDYSFTVPATIACTYRFI